MAIQFAGASAPVVQFRFNDLPLSCIEHEGDLWMPSEDIGRALEYSDPSQGIRNIFNRNKDELEGYSCQLKLSWQTPDSDSEDPVNASEADASGTIQRRPVRVFNEEGVMILTMLSSQPKAASFRAWAVKILKAYRHGELALEKAGRFHDEVLVTCIREARHGNPAAIHTLIDRYGYPESIRLDAPSPHVAQRGRSRPQIGMPESVRWFLEQFLPELQAEIETEPGELLGSIRDIGRSVKTLEEVMDEDAVWSLRHTAADLYDVLCVLMEARGIAIDASSSAFFSSVYQHMCWSHAAPRWERVLVKGNRAARVFDLRLLKEVRS